MKGFLVVTARELIERKLAFAAAAAASVLPFLGPLLPGTSLSPAREVRSVVATILAIAFAFAYALVFGSAVVVRDLVDRRAGFYFSRPLSSPAIAGGKLFAAWLLALSGLVLIPLPVFLVDGVKMRSSLLPDRRLVIAALVLGCALLVALAHGVSSMARLRSPWLAIDAVLLPATVIGFWAAAHRLVATGYLGYWQPDWEPFVDSAGLGAKAALGIVGALVFAALVQAHVGRTDPQRAHGAFSVALWGLSLPFVVALLLFAWWVATPRLADITWISNVTASPRGEWFALSGQTVGRGYTTPMFLCDISSRRFVRLGIDGAVRSPVFSADGMRVAWIRPEIGFRSVSYEVVTVDLSRGDPQSVTWDIPVNSWSKMVLSPTGKRLAVLEGGTLSVYELANGHEARGLGAARIPDTEDYPGFLFVTEDRIRVFMRRLARSAAGTQSLPILDFNLPSKRLLESGRVESSDGMADLHFSPDGELVLCDERGRRLSLHDGRTGALLSVLASGPGERNALFLSNGGIAVAEVRDDVARLLLFTPDGRLEREVAIGAALRASLVGERAPRKIVVALEGREASLLVDTATGTLHRVEGLVPADRWWKVFISQHSGAVGSNATLLYRDLQSLVYYDPMTGQRRTLFESPWRSRKISAE